MLLCQFAGQIRNGEYSWSPIVGRYSGYNNPARIRSSGSALWMKFSSDYSVTRAGFYVQYTATGDGAPIIIVIY